MTQQERESWHAFFLRIAALWATRSKDPGTKCGAVIVNGENLVVSSGYNGLPRRIVDSVERLENRQRKLELTVHAEINAILNAARLGVSIRGCTLYTTPLVPCSSCAPLIVNSGISQVVTDGRVWDDPINRSEDVAMQFIEAGIPIIQIEAE